MTLTEEDLQTLISVMEEDREKLKNKLRLGFDKYENGFTDGVIQTMDATIELLENLKNS